LKKLLAALFLLGFLTPLFSFELTDLEKRIIRAGPEEMLSIVLDSSMESQLLAVYQRYEEDIDLEEVVAGYMDAFPEVSEEDCQFMLFKLGLVSSLGCGDWQTVYYGLDLLMFCIQINTMADMEELPEEFADLINSAYWQDCTGFSRLFDSESFMAARYPDEF
jgi:hypothetical protein